MNDDESRKVNVTDEERISGTEEPCSLCKGSGEVDSGTCPACKGSRMERKRRTRTRTLAERRARMHTGYERRTFSFTPGAIRDAVGIAVRSAGTGDPAVDETITHLVGHAIRYGASYDVSDRIGTFSEEMRAGACTQTLGDADEVVFLYDHAGLVMGRTSAQTLRLSEDPDGLGIEVDLDNRQTVARDLGYAIERGDVHQMSVGFSVLDDEWNGTGTVRKINAIRLFDVSAVGIPASPTTTISVADATDARSGMDDARLVVRSALAALRPIAGEMPEEHRALSAAGVDTLAESLEALHVADDFALPMAVLALEAIDQALDAAQSAVSEVLGVPDPDGDPEDLEPALAKPGTSDDQDTRARDLQLIEIRRKRLTCSN